MATVHNVVATLDERTPTSRLMQATMIATTIPFAVLTPPIAGFMLGGMLLLRWDLRREFVWWGLVAAGFFLPWIYIFAAMVFLGLGGTKPRPRYHVNVENIR